MPPDRYSPLPRAMQKAHFLVTIQLPLLESYHTRISSSLVAFETLSSIFVRSVPGALSFGREPLTDQDDPRNRTSGPAGANSLCKALLSATYMEFCLEEWGEDMVCVISYPFRLRSDRTINSVFLAIMGRLWDRPQSPQLGGEEPSSSQFNEARFIISK